MRAGGAVGDGDDAVEVDGRGTWRDVEEGAFGGEMGGGRCDEQSGFGVEEGRSASRAAERTAD